MSTRLPLPLPSRDEAHKRRLQVFIYTPSTRVELLFPVLVNSHLNLLVFNKPIRTNRGEFNTLVWSVMYR